MSRINRRTMLRSSGVAVALPLLDAMSQPKVRATQQDAGHKSKQRMVLIDLAFGLHSPHFFPKAVGQDYESTPYLDLLKDFRKDYTVISGLSHPGVSGGHPAYKSYLTSAPNPDSSRFQNTVSLDQFAANSIGPQTRFDSLVLSTWAARSSSFSRNGVEIPPESRPSRLFAKMFVEGSPAEKRKQLQRLKDGQSILDAVSPRAKLMNEAFSNADRSRVDQYFSAIRDVENRLQKAESWVGTPKPTVQSSPPTDIADQSDVIGMARTMFDIIALALQSDATRVISFHNACGNVVPPITGVTQDYHGLTHHGQNPERIAQLAKIESEQVRVFHGFLKKLSEIQEEDGRLLDRTMVLFGSALGNGSNHDNRNLPIILAGGAARHGQHLAFDRNKNAPLSNLFVSMLQGLGMEVDRFGSATGPLVGIDFKV